MPINKEDSLFKQIDRKYCGSDRCRFILPVVITEQESKAQMHFRQLAFLAGKIGRTIVLPNVHSSHLGACLSSPFDFYYDQIKWLKENRKGHFNYITMSEFKAWIKERQAVGVLPTAQEIHIQGSQKSKLLKKQKNCFKSSFDFSDRPISSYQFLDISHPRKKDGNITQIMMSLLGDQAREYEHIGGSDKPVDVINLFYDRRYNFIRNEGANVPIPYSQNLVNIADKISSQLKPYMAIHWRMERLEPLSNLVPCAEDLIERIHKLDNKNQEHQHPNVFLLTDYPHLLNATGARPESSSFYSNQLRPEHHQAIRHLYEHLNVTLTSATDRPIPYKELPSTNWNIIPIDTHADQSILGIIDKLVAMKAQWFFAGKPGVCAKSSSFTGRISVSRLKAFREGDKDIIVPLETFNMPS
ncbi:hypothetical protein G6F46_004319 [Rhizopus delemar]|nr:hypothetical protein G6F55_008746 [Rhizopus delemar]KAG1552596.1 hypothetical protein G6F51_001119 [Rhizopus arrhizus]KAG1492531.1 hypothetical protein G6F54_009249 [Rhizopus delemar]KAG1516434.1 hypothetical protein G6F53_002166 [Rhizopus delemar]KAG1521851.1 hypothetical protein G6F52_006370 [Rhizopus delemar]